MKIFEYRFSESHIEDSSYIAHVLAKSLCSEESRSICMIKSDKFGKIIRDISPIECAISNISDTFIKSFSNYSSYDNYYSFKSVVSLQFFVIEDDGLVRICMKNSYDPNIFRGVLENFQDASYLLIDTDMFDYI